MKTRRIAVRYFKSIGYEVEEDVVLMGRWGLEYRFDLLVRDGNGLARGIWVKDWRRTVGINVVIRLDRASEEVGLGRPILIANRFSPSVYMYASKRGIELLTINEVSRFLERQNPDRPSSHDALKTLSLL